MARQIAAGEAEPKPSTQSLQEISARQHKNKKRKSAQQDESKEWSVKEKVRRAKIKRYRVATHGGDGDDDNADSFDRRYGGLVDLKQKKAEQMNQQRKAKSNAPSRHGFKSKQRYKRRK